MFRDNFNNNNNTTTTTTNNNNNYKTMSKTHSLPRRKVLLLGNSACGKTQLVKAQQGKGVRSRHVPSMLEASLVDVSLPSQRKVELEVWEVGGGSKAADLLKIATTGSDITAAICFSIDDPESLFHAYQYWRIQLRILTKDPRILLVACKSDLRKKRPTDDTSKHTRRVRRHVSSAASSRTTSSKISADSGISMSSSSSDNPQRPPRRRRRQKKEESSPQELPTPALIPSTTVSEAASNIDADVLECSSYDLRSVETVFQKLGEMALSEC